MGNPARSAADEEQGKVVEGKQQRRRRVVAALWLGIAALAITAALFPLFSVVTTFPAAILVLRLLGLALGGTAVALSLRARTRQFDRKLGGWALASGIAGLAVDAMLMAAIAIGVMLARPNITEVELRAEGGPVFTVEFDDDVRSHTQQWERDGWAHFNTEKNEARITVTAPDDDPGARVSCTIVWDGEIVVEESSRTGTVTCRYEE